MLKIKSTDNTHIMVVCENAMHDKGLQKQQTNEQTNPSEPTNKQIITQIHKHTKQTNKQTNQTNQPTNQTNKDTNTRTNKKRKTNKQASKQTNKHTRNHTNKQTKQNKTKTTQTNTQKTNKSKKKRELNKTTKQRSKTNKLKKTGQRLGLGARWLRLDVLVLQAMRETAEGKVTHSMQFVSNWFSSLQYP